jgi:hypothetical protein
VGEVVRCLPNAQLKAIASKLWAVGNVLREAPEQINTASLWLQKGLEVIEEAEKLDSGLGVKDIKIALLRSTGKFYSSFDLNLTLSSRRGLPRDA